MGAHHTTWDEKRCENPRAIQGSEFFFPDHINYLMENVPKKPNEKLRILLIAILQGNRRIDRSVGELEFWKTPSVSRDTTILMGIDSCPGIPLCWNNHVSVWRQGNYTSSPPWRPFFHHPGKKKKI